VEAEGALMASKKAGRTYTIRGAFPFADASQHPADLGPIRIQLWNGSWTKNWVIEEVQVIFLGTNYITHTMLGPDLSALVIATEKNGAIPNYSSTGITGRSCRDNRQVWWGSYAPNVTTQNVLDPDHLFVQDLWINGWAVDADGAGNRYALSQEIGYIITLRQVKTTISQAVLSLIKEQAQDMPE